jgi:hypothetical protein
MATELQNDFLEVCERNGYKICNCSKHPARGLGSRCENCNRFVVAMLMDRDSSVTTNNDTEFKRIQEKFSIYRYICVTDKDYNSRFK